MPLSRSTRMGQVPHYTLASRPDPLLNEGHVIYVDDAPTGGRIQYAEVIEEESTGPATPQYGPTGTKKPANCPDYDTPADATVTTFAGIQSAVTAASAGDVIEYTGADLVGTDPSVLRTLTGGDAGWATKVLIRPPLAQRTRIDSIDLQTTKVVLAGFDVTNRAGFVTPATNSDLWRMIGTQGGTQWLNVTAIDCSMVECVGAQRLYGTISDARVLVIANGETDNLRPRIDGCFFAGQILGVDIPVTTTSGSHTLPTGTINVASTAEFLASGTFAVGGQTVTYTGKTATTFTGCTGGTGAISAGSRVAGTRPLDVAVNNPTVGATLGSTVLPSAYTVNTIMVATPGLLYGDGNTITVQLIKVTGGVETVMKTVTAPAPTLTMAGTTYGVTNPDYGVEYDESLAFASGDTLKAKVTAITGTVPRVICQVGVQSGEHADTLQMYRGSSGGGGQFGRVKDFVCRDSMIDGSDNAALQIEMCKGDTVFSNVWMGRDRNYVMNWSSEQGVGAYAAYQAVHFLESYVVNKLHLLGDVTTTIEGNKMQQTPNWRSGTGSIPISATNTIDPLLSLARPSLPDLATIWPDCPPDFDPTFA